MNKGWIPLKWRGRSKTETPKSELRRIAEEAVRSHTVTTLPPGRAHGLDGSLIWRIPPGRAQR